MLFSSGFVDSQDGLLYLTISRRMYYDHTFEMPDATFQDGTNIHMSTMKGGEGKMYAITGLGYSLALLPAVFIEDVFLQLSNQKPIAAFPLENDWPVLLFASFTNSFFGALLTTGMFLYLVSLSLKKKQALVLSFIFLVSSNLFVYTKHTFAHMMFISFLVWTFYFLKRAVQKNKDIFYVLSGACFGVVVISYNQSFIFTLPALATYFFLLQKKESWLPRLKNSVKQGVRVLLGAAPFFATYLWFNRVRFSGTGVESFIEAAQFESTFLPPAYIVFEGLWGVLFSPGKSVFLFSPLLLLLVLFWFKLDRKKFFAEIISFVVLFLTYVWFIGTLMGGVDNPVWHGDSSWGPRYLLATVPFLLLLVGTIVVKLTKRQKVVVFLPLFLLGLWLSIVGTFLPYQIRFQGLQTNARFNGRDFNVSEYGNEIPRYSPAFSQTKQFVKRVLHFQSQYDHGVYDVRLFDGFDYPFDLGWMIWRGMKPYAQISFDRGSKPIDSISFQIKNHQMDPTSSISAQLQFILNGEKIDPIVATILPVETELEFILETKNKTLKPYDNSLEIESEFIGTSSASIEKKQVLFLQILRINGEIQNIHTLDFPYISPVSQGISKIEYGYWGAKQQDPWVIWHMHSGIFEKTFDIWWLRPYHYWDLPKGFFAVLLGIILTSAVYFGINTIVIYKKSLKKSPS